MPGPNALQPCPVGLGGFHRPENSNRDRCANCGAYGIERQGETRTFVVSSGERTIEVPVFQINSLATLFKAKHPDRDEGSTVPQASAESWLLVFLASIAEGMEQFEPDDGNVGLRIPVSMADVLHTALGDVLEEAGA